MGERKEKESRSIHSSHFGNIYFPLLDVKMKEFEEVKSDVVEVRKAIWGLVV